MNPYAQFQLKHTLEGTIGEFCLIPATLETVGLYPEGCIASIDKFGIQIWDLAIGKPIARLKGHTNYVTSLALSPDGKALISGSGDKTLRIWDIASGDLIQQLNGHTKGVSVVRISHDGQYIVSGSRDRTIKIWNRKTGALVKTLSGKTQAIFDLRLGLDGATIICTTQRNTVKIWNWQSGKLLHTLSGNPDGTHIAINPNGKHLYTYGSFGHVINVWAIDTGKQIDTIQIYDEATPGNFNTGRSLQVAPLGYFLEVLPTPDSNLILVAGRGDLKIWDIQNRQVIATYAAPEGTSIVQLTMNSDARTLYVLWSNYLSIKPSHFLQIWQR
jgi:WD40 repeat protein